MTLIGASIRGLILDMDGVLWRSNQPIGDLPAIFAEMERRGYRVILATNNATLTVNSYLEKLIGFGVRLQRCQIVSSSQATAHYLHQLYPLGSPVFIIGEEGLVEALGEQGFYHDDGEASAVVVGWDRQLTYEKLRRAALLIRNGASFIATNPDRTYPTPEGLVPGNGATLAALEAATDVKPIVVGKPSPEMYRVALERLQTSQAETLVVGDRLETDIAGAQALGCPTGLVLSGVTGKAEAFAWEPPLDLIAGDLATLLESIE